MSDIAESLQDTHEHGADKWIAVYIALLAVLLSVCGIGGGNSTKDSMQNNIQASDTWAFYQAKNQRQTSYRLASDALHLRLGEPGTPRGRTQGNRDAACRLQGRDRPPGNRARKGRGQERTPCQGQGFRKPAGHRAEAGPVFRLLPGVPANRHRAGFGLDCAPEQAVARRERVPGSAGRLAAVQRLHAGGEHSVPFVARPLSRPRSHRQ